MSEPNTVNKGLIVANTGDLVDLWADQALNPDFVALDAMLGGVATVSLTNTPVTLTVPSGSIVPAAGPTQCQNAVINFTGTISANVTVTFGLPGFYIVKNSCVVSTFAVIAKSGAGNVIGLPQGRAVHIYSDGTNMDFVNMPEVGSFMDYAGGTDPTWIAACTVKPWLKCDGTIYNIADQPNLYAVIGSVYGGNGLTTFAVPDQRNRARYPFDSGTPTNRITNAVSAITGTAVGSAGGDQSMQQHIHGVTDPGHLHPQNPNTLLIQGGSTGGGTSGSSNVIGGNTQSAVTGISINNTGAGASQNMPPALIVGSTWIKT